MSSTKREPLDHNAQAALIRSIIHTGDFLDLSTIDKSMNKECYKLFIRASEGIVIKKDLVLKGMCCMISAPGKKVILDSCKVIVTAPDGITVYKTRILVDAAEVILLGNSSFEADEVENFPNSSKIIQLDRTTKNLASLGLLPNAPELDQILEKLSLTDHLDAAPNQSDAAPDIIGDNKEMAADD